MPLHLSDPFSYDARFGPVPSVLFKAQPWQGVAVIRCLVFPDARGPNFLAGGAMQSHAQGVYRPSAPPTPRRSAVLTMLIKDDFNAVVAVKLPTLTYPR